MTLQRRRWHVMSVTGLTVFIRSLPASKIQITHHNIHIIQEIHAAVTMCTWNARMRGIGQFKLLGFQQNTVFVTDTS